MSAETFFSSVIEIAIGMAGFAGIIAAIRQRGISDWPSQQLVQLQILFGASSMAICFSLLPLALGGEGIDERLIWKIGGVGLIVWYVGIAIYRSRQCKRLGVPLAIPVFLRFWVAIVGALQLVNIFSPGYAWPYLLGVFSLLVNGFSVFLLLLLSPQEKHAAVKEANDL